ncbi:MAG: alkaline phosphatase family protein [Bacteroidales bacterium]|nr:alkaline phosphatase family protein [Bacteroidales bacterium]
MKRLIGIFVDALNPRFISKENTPFLYDLSQGNPAIELETLLGFSDAIDASIFTGTYPDTNDYWMKFQYNPEQSIFKNIPITYPLKVLDFIPPSFSLIRSGINYAMYHTIYKQFSKRYGYDGLASFNMPYKILHNFDFTLKKSLMGENPFENIPTIFDLLRKNDKTFYYTHGIKKDTLKMLRKSDLGIVYLSDADAAAQLFGVDCPRFFNTLRNLDSKIKFIFEKFKGDPDTNFILFSDHGMAKVDKILTFNKLLKNKEFNKRYLLTLDGTMVRFWYFDADIKQEIQDILKGESYGHFLTKGEKTDLRINFAHNKYGDDIFLLDQGYSIFPNFFSWAKPEAMHSYHPSYKEQKGIVILCGKPFDDVSKTLARTVDLMPSMLNYLGMDVPNTIEGESLIG